VRNIGTDIVVIVSGIVALKTVAGIKQKEIFRTRGRAQAIHIVLHRHQAGPGGLPLHIRTVKPGTVHVTGGNDMKCTLLRSGADCGREYNGRSENPFETKFHKMRF